MPRPLSIAVGVLMILAMAGISGWGLFRILKRCEDPARVVFKLVLSLLLFGGIIVFALKVGSDNAGSFTVPVLCVVFGIVMSILWARHWGAALASPFTAMFDGGDVPPDPQPLYSAAIAKRKRGKYAEAIADIRKQLETFPTDFTGQLMLAEIQAEDLKDLSSAEVAIQRICNQEGHPPARIASALARLADWHMKYRQDPDSARLCLEEIQARFPSTEFSHMAAQRLSHLSTREQLIGAGQPHTIAISQSVTDAGLYPERLKAAQAENPAAIAEGHIRHLEEHPLDCEVREKLALIYANHYSRADMAIEQLQQIISQPGIPTREICRLYSVMADVHMKVNGDVENARKALKELIDRFPNSAAAEMSRQRLGTLKLELRSRQQNGDVKMGTYEQDLGLKRKL